MTSHWPQALLSNHLEFLTSGSRGWAQYYADSGSLFIRIQNVGRNKLLLDDVAYVKVPESAESRRTKVRPGDVLLSITADLGRSCVIPNGIGDAHINQHLAIVRAKGVDPNFLSAYIQTPEGQRQILKLDKGGVKSGLNFDDIHSLRFPLPSLPEQRRIAAILDQADALRAKRRQALTKLDGMIPAMLLVGCDSNSFSS